MNNTFNVMENQQAYICTLPEVVQALIQKEVKIHLESLDYESYELEQHIQNAMSSRLADIEEVINYEELQDSINKLTK